MNRGKMVCLSKVIAMIVVALTVYRDATAQDTDLMTTNNVSITTPKELLINEGDFLAFKCTHFNRISFIYPHSENSTNYSMPYITEEVEGGLHTYIFQRPETVPGDTGLYGCPNSHLEIISHPDFQQYQDLVYVYVQSNTSVFVREEEDFKTLIVPVGGTVVIPCKPTSPNFTVRLFQEEKLKEETDFNPRIGFTLSKLTLQDGGYMKCAIEDHEVCYHLFVISDSTMNKPKIMDHTLRHVTRGQTLNVNCSTMVDASTLYLFNWSTPQQSPRIKTRQYHNHLGQRVEAITELIIKDIRDEDQGEYECIITTFSRSEKTKTFITVHDPEYKFINLTAQDPNRYYEVQEGDSVQWVVYVHAHPQPSLKWLDTKGEEIIGNWEFKEKAKYAIKSSYSETVLRINRLDINDMGEYFLQASNNDKIETLNFTLNVSVKPLPMLDVEPYYAPNQMVEIPCNVATFPSPNITWTFTKCPDYPSCQDASTERLMNTKTSGMNTEFRSIVEMTVKSNGYLTCTACNKIGCEFDTKAIQISDGKNGFGIIEPNEPVVEGDNIELICAMVIYNQTNNFKWKYANNTPIEQNSRLTIHKTSTQYTYRSILRIQNVTKADSTSYTCSNKEEMDFFLQVHDAESPYFKETNLYQNKTTIDVNAPESQPLTLRCFVGGMPKPKVTWYKDDTVLKFNNQYTCDHDYQEMHIKYLREADSGKFSCRVKNRIGTLDAYVIITVKGKELSKELPKELIILIVILSIIIVILVVYFTIKVRRERIMRRKLLEAGLVHFEEGAVECLNPDLTVDDQAELLPYDKKWEFPREKLKLGKRLGSGAFGVVMKAEAEGICENEPITTVAVKMVRRTTTDPSCVRALASELKIMVHLGKHLNVVNLLGACTKNISKRELLVIVEYCRFGNLYNYLFRHRADFIDQIDPTTGKFDPSIGIELLTKSASVSSNNRIKYVALSFSRSLSDNSTTDPANRQTAAVDSQGVNMSPDGDCSRGDYKNHNLKPICTQDLLSWAFQVARGMEYLSQRKVLHGDLAARNILLAEDNVVKICDFGLAKTMYKESNYKKKGDGLLPIKWMAIESIKDRIFSTQSDIWSFGIVLWEFFTLAETPYPGLEAEKQYRKLIEGYRMEQPKYATSEVYDIMLECWKAVPTQRPSFTELVRSIGELLEESVRARYISLNDPYMDMNTTMLESGRSDYLTMLSAPDHAILSSPTQQYSNFPAPNSPDSAYLCMSPTSQRDESGIFSYKSSQPGTLFEFPVSTSDAEDAVELSPMLKEKDDDPYLKPTDIHQRRAQFIRQRQSMKNQSVERSVDEGHEYCNAPRNIQLIDLNEKNKGSLKNSDDIEKLNNENTMSKKDFMPAIISTQDNYVNMPKQKSDLRLDILDGFSNPSYVMITNRERDQTRV